MNKTTILFFYGIFLNLLLFGIQTYYTIKTTKKIRGSIEKGKEILKIENRYKKVKLEKAKEELEQAKKDIIKYSDGMIKEYQGIVKMSKDYYWCIVIVIATLTIFNFFQFNTLGFVINFLLHILLYHLISSNVNENIAISKQKQALFKLNTTNILNFYDSIIKEADVLIKEPEKLKEFLKQAELRRETMKLKEE